MERGREVGSLTSLLDIAPTLLDLSGVEPPTGMHGLSQGPVLRGEADYVRDFAFSAGGIQNGFSVRDDRYTFQKYDPGSRGPSTLYRSWFGEGNPIRNMSRQHLRDRKTQRDLGNLQESAVAPEVRETLRAAGEEWYHWVERARLHVQRAPWVESNLDPKEREELERRGLLAPSELDAAG